MAISLLTSGTDTASTDTAFTTASVSPSASNVTWLGFMVGGLPPTGAPTPSGARGTWTLVSTVSSTFFRAYLYAGTGTATAEAITVTRQGTDTWDGSAWVVSDDTDATTPVVQSATGSDAGDTATATLAAFAAGSHALSISFTENGTGSSAQASWTQLANPSIIGLMSFAMAYRLSDAVTTVLGTFTGGGVNTRVLGAEIAPASGGSTQPPRTYYTNRRRRV